MSFDTCLGKLRSMPLAKSEDGDLLSRYFVQGLGVDADYKPLESVLDKIGFISPTGVVFVNKETRVGLLPKMLSDLLDTRIMIKRSMTQEEDPQVYCFWIS